MFEITSPVDGSIVAKIPYTDKVEALLVEGKAAQKDWARRPVAERVEVLRRGVAAAVADKARLGRELTMLMGRPIRYTEGEISGFEFRATHMLDIAGEQLGPDNVGEGMTIVKEPVGTVLIIGAWNYPYLVVVNMLIAALAAGNAVVIKHASQTAPVGDNLRRLFVGAGLPSGLLHSVHLTNAQTEELVTNPLINYVSLVGSVGAGQAVLRRASARTSDFARVSLELGGCDAAYVRADAKLPESASALAEGAFFNSGQSCCGVQRVFVHDSVYKEFCEKLEEAVAEWRLGDPLDPQSTLGPVVSADAAQKVRSATKSDCGSGRVLRSPDGALGPAYVAPTVYFNPAPGSTVLEEEIFGPVLAVCPIKDDAEAIRRINETRYGLTASIWTAAEAWVPDNAHQIDVGTVYANRCDVLHPGLPWSGVKLSGLGFTLSKYAYDHVTRMKALNCASVP